MIRALTQLKANLFYLGSCKFLLKLRFKAKNFIWPLAFDKNEASKPKNWFID